MAAIELTGRINENGELEVKLPAGLGPGPVHITIETIDPDQAWFWSSEWQVTEREADEDIASGNVEIFSSMDDLIDDLLNDET